MLAPFQARGSLHVHAAIWVEPGTIKEEAIVGTAPRKDACKTSAERSWRKFVLNVCHLSIAIMPTALPNSFSCCPAHHPSHYPARCLACRPTCWRVPTAVPACECVCVCVRVCVCACSSAMDEHATASDSEESDEESALKSTLDFMDGTLEQYQNRPTDEDADDGFWGKMLCPDFHRKCSATLCLCPVSSS